MTLGFKEGEITWKEAETLENWFRRMVREKKDVITKTLDGLPESLRNKYRKICNEEREELNDRKTHT